jgi:hypothetical protein
MINKEKCLSERPVEPQIKGLRKKITYGTNKSLRNFTSSSLQYTELKLLNWEALPAFTTGRLNPSYRRLLSYVM